MSSLKTVYHRWHHQRAQGRRLRELRQRLRRRLPVVLVHQMGRAASMTMVNTIQDMDLEMPVLHTHWLNPVSLDVRLGWAERDNDRSVPFNIRVSKVILDALPGDAIVDYPWRIVSVIREPVARNVSAYFLSIDRFIPNVYERYRSGNIDMSEIRETFLREYLHEIPLSWFDREVDDVFGVDVYAHSFPNQGTYALIEQGAIRIAIVKVEALEDAYRPALERLLGHSPGALRNTHISVKDEPYAEIYREFLRSPGLPRGYLEKMYDSVFARHFYSPAERSEFMERWGGANR